MRCWIIRLISSKICKAAFLLLCFSCGPNKPEDFRSEGLAIVRELTKDLKEVRSEEDLKKKKAQLTKKFDQLAKLILDVHKWRAKHPDVFFQDFEESLESRQLQEQLKRICLISGGTEILETCQRQSLDKLKKILR